MVSVKELYIQNYTFFMYKLYIFFNNEHVQMSNKILYHSRNTYQYKKFVQTNNFLS